MVYVWTHCDFESIFNIHNRKLGTSLVGYELEKVRIDMDSVYRSRLLRIRFSADLTMYWFPVSHFRCKECKSLVIWIRNQNIAISTIVGTSSHIKARILKMYSRSAKGGEKGDSNRNPWIAKMAMQWPNEKGQMINSGLQKTTQKTEDWAARIPLKTRTELCRWQL